MKKDKKKNSPFLAIVLIAFLVLCLTGGVAAGLYFFLPSFQEDSYFKYVERGKPDEYAIVYGENPIEDTYFAVRFEDDVLIDTAFLIDYEIDKHILWDNAEQILTITTPLKIMRLKPNEAFYMLNGEQRRFSKEDTALYIKDDKVFLPISFVCELYQIECKLSEDSNILVIDNLLTSRTIATAKARNTAIRHNPDIKSAIAQKVRKGDTLAVYGASGGFYKVRTESGSIGYVASSDVANVTEIAAHEKIEDTAPLIERFKGRAFTLVWEQIAGEGSSNWVDSKSPSINITSPTWFSLSDENGGITDRGSLAYVRRAKSSGYEVWPLFDNGFMFNSGFTPDDTHDILVSTAKRERLVNDLIELAKKYNVTGVNIDFEAYRIDDGYYYTQFLCELGVAFRENGLVSSVDLTVPTMQNSPTDRERIGKYVDYVIVMAYDQHWSTSPEAGPVAGYDWVEQGIERTLTYVTKEKVVLGLPLYGRIWYTPKGGSAVSSRDFAMQKAYDLFVSRNAKMEWDDITKYTKGEYEYNVDGVPTIITSWLETTESLRHKAELAVTHNLAGTACWKKGLESDGVFSMLAEVVK